MRSHALNLLRLMLGPAADFRPGQWEAIETLAEAHCISDWGHDFRPDYRRIVRILQGLPGGVPVLGTTATANDRVVKEVQERQARRCPGGPTGPGTWRP